MRFFWILVLLLQIMVTPYLFAQFPDIYFERLIPSSNGKSLPVIHCIYQDHQGFLWITSPYGLARYDGNEFLIFNHMENDPHSLIDNYLFSVMEDSHNRLWITTDQGLELLDRETGHFIHFRHDSQNINSLPSNRLRSITEDQNGQLWIGTLDAGLCRFDYQTNTFTRYRHDPANNNTPSSDSNWALYCDDHNRLWTGSHEGKLDCFNPQTGQWSHHNLFPANSLHYGSANVWDICEDHDGNIWLATSSLGLIRLDPDSGDLQYVPLRKKSRQWQTDHKILTLCRSSDDKLWLGTEGAGIFLYDPDKGTVDQYTVNTKRPGSLCDDTVFTVFEDREGLLWFGTGKGISMYNKNRFRFPRVQFNAQSVEKLADNNILAIYEDKNGILWISTAQGGLNIWDRKNDQWNPALLPARILDSFKIHPVHAICEDADNNIWFGNDRGLYFFEQNEGKISFMGDIIEEIIIPRDFKIMTMIPGKDNCIWMANRKGQLFRWDVKTRRAYLYPNLLQKSEGSMYYVQSIFLDRKGGIWVGTKWHGVNYLWPETNTWINYKYQGGEGGHLASRTVYSIIEDQNGRIWAGTEAGPCFLEPNAQKWKSLTATVKLPDHSAYGLLVDNSNKLWMSSKKGLILIDPVSGEWRLYGPEDGIQNLYFNPGVCYKSRSGELFFGGISGFNYYYPEKIYLNLHTPPLAIASISNDNKKFSRFFKQEMHPLEITQNDLPLIVRIAALSFAFPRKNHYKVTELGAKPEKYYLGTRHVFYITGLSPGTHRFLIQGSNHDLVWNEKGMELTILIKSPLYRYWYLAGILLVLGVAYYLRLRYLRKQKISIQVIPKNIAPLAKQFQLTKREQEIIVMVLDGKSNKQIEDELFISLKTVKSHLYNIYRKLDVKNRLQLMNTITGILRNKKKLF